MSSSKETKKLTDGLDSLITKLEAAKVGTKEYNKALETLKSNYGEYVNESLIDSLVQTQSPGLGNLMIELKNLCKSFDGREVLKNISTVFEDGKTNLIIGQSGSGKTVLMKNLVGLFEPTSGQILYDGRDFVRLSKNEKVHMRREMGMIFQSAALFDSMTVLENVMFPLDMFSNMNLRERTKRAMECLDRVNLVGAEEKFPGEISGGMQKRVAIARAIALNPKYLFCDEPNSGLDPKTSLVIDELLHSITHEFNMTTIINTHDMNSVMGIGENIIFIYEGNKEWQGVSSQIMNSTNKRLTDFIFASDLLKEMRAAVTGINKK
jgi:phospholipid/cholesterol/gamma-HCH transport system ATP-binding protein